MEDLKSLLNITPVEYKNVVKIEAKWTYYNDEDPDDESCICQNSFDADEFFKDKRLIWSLAYLLKYVPGDSEYIDFDDLECIAKFHYDIWPFSKDDETSSIAELKIIYYDENGKPSKVTFDDIYKRWDNMSEEEVCKEVNEVLKNNKNED